MSKFKHWTITFSLLIGSCRSSSADTASTPTVSGASGACSGKLENLSAGCLQTIFMHLPDKDIVRYVNAIVKNNIDARNALLAIAQKAVPDWRKDQIREGLRGEACHYGHSNAGDGGIALSFQKELLRNYIAYLKVLNDANTPPPLVTNIARLPDSGMAVLIGKNTIVYQDATRALVLLDTTTGKPIFRYEIGNIIVRNFAKLNDDQFLSFHDDGKIYLWKSKPASGDKEPIKKFRHEQEDFADFVPRAQTFRARLIVIDDHTFVSIYIKYAHAFNTQKNKRVSAIVGTGEHVTTIAPGRVLIPSVVINLGTIVDQVWDVETGAITNGPPTGYDANGFLNVGHDQTLVRSTTETYIKDYSAGNRIATLPFSFGASMISSEKLLLKLGRLNLSIYDTKNWNKLLDLSTAANSIGQISNLQGDYFAIALSQGIEIRSWAEPEKMSRLVSLRDIFARDFITDLATTTDGDGIIQSKDKTVIFSPWGQIAKNLKPTIF